MKFSPKEFGHRLVVARHNIKLNQDEASALLDVGDRTLGSIERGEADMKISTLFKAAEVYKTTVQQLLGVDEGKVVNSFNNIHERAFVQNQNNIAKLNKEEWAELVQSMEKHMTFMESLIGDYQKIMLAKIQQ
jgi:transcriptional regulator with XRE-family HTH domain